MAELIGHLVASIGVDRNAARTAVVTTHEFMADACGKVGNALGEIAGALPDLLPFV